MSSSSNAPAQAEDESFQVRQWDCIQRIRAARAKHGVEDRKISSEEERTLVGEFIPLISRLIYNQVERLFPLIDAAGMTAEDAQQEALLKVIPHILDGYDPLRSKVSTYVGFLTRQHLTNLLQNKVIRVRAGFATKVWRARELYQKQYDVFPTNEQLIEAGYLSAEERPFLNALKETRSGSETYDSDSSESRETHYRDQREVEPGKATAIQDEVQHIVSQIDALKDIHLLAPTIARIRLCVGEDDSIGVQNVPSFDQIAAKVGLSESKVRYIFNKSLRRLQGHVVPVDAVQEEITHPNIIPAQQPSAVSTIESTAPKAPLYSRQKLFIDIYQAISQQLPEQYRPAFQSLISNPGRPLLYTDLLPQGNSGTDWQRKTKVTDAVRAANALFQQHDFECGAILGHEPLRQEGGFAFINRSCVPFDIARELTFFQWQLLDIYARNEGSVVTDEEVANTIWGKFDPNQHHALIQQALGKIRARDKGNGFHIAYMDRKGAANGHSCALESNIPSTLRLSLGQSVLLSALLFRYQNPHPSHGEWVPIDELKHKLQTALASVPPGNAQMKRQDVQITMQNMQTHHLSGIGSIEDWREDNKHKTISAYRLASWFQPKEDMLPEPTAYVRAEQRTSGDGEIPLEILYMLSQKLGCIPKAGEPEPVPMATGDYDLTSLHVDGMPPFIETFFLQAVREHQFTGGLSLSQRKVLAQMWIAYGSYVSFSSLESATGLSVEQAQKTIDILNKSFFKSSVEQIRFHEGKGWVLSKTV